ncbi:MAG: hypothetical protein QOE61_6947 [Micromonosporaceae bacterium]|jgi:O-methyltransferase involved in polyketide biosynthesis|nr:hypothetical protein [Micromonosporaceae bacterium]
MRRADNDTWDLASSVGATATMVAAARAVATRSPDPLVSDPFAEPLVKAVGIDSSPGWPVVSCNQARSTTIPFLACSRWPT